MSDHDAAQAPGPSAMGLRYGARRVVSRLPVWLDGSVNDLASCIEYAALSENSIARGMYVLQEGIEPAAEGLRDACADAPDTLQDIADGLHQRDGVQTSRMAMAIVAYASRDVSESSRRE